MDAFRIEGERLALEPVRPEHAERLVELRRTPEVTRWWDPPPEGWPLKDEADMCGLTILVDGEVAGYVQFWEEPDPDGQARRR